MHLTVDNGHELKIEHMKPYSRHSLYYITVSWCELQQGDKLFRLVDWGTKIRRYLTSFILDLSR